MHALVILLVSRGGKAFLGCSGPACDHMHATHTATPSIFPSQTAACSQTSHSGVKAESQGRRQEGSRCFRAEHPAVQHRLSAMKPRLQLELMLLAALLVSSSMLTVCAARWVPSVQCRCAAPEPAAAALHSSAHCTPAGQSKLLVLCHSQLQNAAT